MGDRDADARRYGAMDQDDSERDDPFFAPKWMIQLLIRSGEITEEQAKAAEDTPQPTPKGWPIPQKTFMALKPIPKG